MRIIVASTNPVKMNAVRLGHSAMFPGEMPDVCGCSVPSGVSDQPIGDEETLRGAENRAENARLGEPDADMWIGIEGGIASVKNDMECFAWVVVHGKDGRIGRSKTATFALPPEVGSLVRGGMELGKADDRVFGRTNSGNDNGTVGILTADAIHRTAYYEHAVILALIPFKNASLFPA